MNQAETNAPIDTIDSESLLSTSESKRIKYLLDDRESIAKEDDKDLFIRHTRLYTEALEKSKKYCQLDKRTRDHYLKMARTSAGIIRTFFKT